MSQTTAGYKRPRTRTVVVMPSKRARTATVVRPSQAKTHSALIASNRKRPEVKVAVLKVNPVGIGSVGAGTSLAYDLFGGMTQGTGMRNQFIGRKFNPIGIDLRYTVSQGTGDIAATGGWNPLVRCSLVQYMNSYNKNTPPGAAAIYEDGTSVHSGFELVNWEQIDCLHDNLMSLSTTVSPTATQQSGDSFSFHKYIKGSKIKKVSFDDTVGGGGAWKEGGLLLYVYADADWGATKPSFEAWVRVYYTDD